MAFSSIFNVLWGTIAFYYNWKVYPQQRKWSLRKEFTCNLMIIFKWYNFLLLHRLHKMLHNAIKCRLHIQLTSNWIILFVAFWHILQLSRTDSLCQERVNSQLTIKTHLFDNKRFAIWSFFYVETTWWIGFGHFVGNHKNTFNMRFVYKFHFAQTQLRFNIL